MIKFTGNHPRCNRVITDCYSMDRAFINHAGELGVPVGASWETFGAKGIGKSSFAYSLAGLIANKLKGGIVVSDFEGYDESYIELLLNAVKFEGEVHSVRDSEDEKQLMESLDLLSNPKKNFNVLVLDSISAISPVGEQGGELGERNMGQRAFMMAQFARRALHIHRFQENKTILTINHWIPDLSGNKYSYVSPGGSVKNYLMTVLLHLSRGKEWPDGSYILKGTVRKNRWGYSDRTFNLFMVGGMGLSLDMTAVWDCITYKVATYDKTVKLGDVSYGRMSGLVKSARLGEDVFSPFKKALENLNEKDVIENGTQSIGDTDEGNETGEVDAVSN